MPVKVFYGENTQFEHEFKQICEVYRYLCQNFRDKEVYLLTNFLTGNNEYDCVILKENAIIILELKAYKGEIKGGENGIWEVIDESGNIIPLENVFQQIRSEKFSLIDKLKPIREKHFPRIDEEDLKKIKCWAYFEKGSTYDKGQVSPSVHVWFDVITIDDLGQKLQFANSRILLTQTDMDVIVNGLHLRPELSELCKTLTKKDTSEPENTGSEEEKGDEKVHHWGGASTTQLIEFDGNCTSNVSKDAKYSIRHDEGEWKVGIVYETADGERWYPVSDKHSELVEMVNRIKKEITKKPGGVFYINEYKQVIVPTVNNKTYYLAGEYAKILEFEFENKMLSGDAKDLTGKPLSPGENWEGPHPGIAYVLSGNFNDIYYEREIRPRVTKRFMLSDYQKRDVVDKICSMIVGVKQASGRFYINEFRQIFSPVGMNPVKYVYVGKLENLHEWFPKPVGVKIDYDGKSE